MISLSFLYLIILKILTFSYTLPSAKRPSRKTRAIRTYHDEEKIPRKKFHLQHTTKTFIKTMEIFSLLNTDLCNWNDSSLIKIMIVFFHVFTSISIYIFPKFTCGIGVKKLIDKFPDKNKYIFSIRKI